ncbi:type I restriction endonuclease subunit R [Helicobacter sp. faydin-H20]|uniref:type I restriction endonuclease subunit R n=1 Tax=Helicobacter anatolicus TaxID=2905874 RepID=UPI001E2A4992|nr:type I restriction endonuclease subunit R [Helicobacter anatolicus]MCE3037029.1 type I restriction endonuclease subunit R [Helicobacter anatolicus]
MSKELHPIAQSNKSTVVAEYTKEKNRENSYQSEKQLEEEFIALLQKQGYEYIKLTSQEELKENLKKQIQNLNNYTFTPKEWETLYTQFIATKNDGFKEKTRKIQIDCAYSLRLENGEMKNIKILDKQNVYNNILQVTNQYTTKGRYENRYDVSVLVNGLPLVHIELKKRGVAIKEAFNQIRRYQKDSFWAEDGLFEYIQIFVISNGVHTKYYSNTTRESHLSKSKKANSFEFTSYWADSTNELILDLIDFTKTFFAKHTLLNILTRYCVFTSDEDLLVMRPYQIVATERILEKINIIHNNKTYGKNASGGYIWHTTGSGKTLTSFKTATLIKELDYINKVLFVVDRKDLDYQTMKEYEKFEQGSANATITTKVLQRQLENPSSKIIITTIQKLDKFIKNNKEHKIFDEEIVMIFDECHRGQLGKMHDGITKAFKKYYLFGFTGTPIFAENCDKNIPLGTTEQKFGKSLHRYTIINAIADKNVLPFKVSYHNTLKPKENIEDKEVSAIDIQKALLDDRRIKEVVEYILENFAHITKHNENYTFNKLDNIESVAKNAKKVEEKRSQTSLKGFNSILACSGIDAVKKYYQAFKEADHNLKIATIYSYSPNEDFDGLEDENNEGVEGLDQSSRDFLEEAIKDYNAMFETTYDTSDAKFQNYYKDLSLRVKNREIDILIVANMFLTGFDATTLNTLWVDKNLKYHGLIQAFSRTNRILNSVKTFGNIVCFRDLEDDLNKALALFGNEKAGGIVLLRKFEDYFYGYTDEKGKEYEGYKTLIEKLLNGFPLGERILSEEKQKEFVKLFGKILKIRNILECFDEFKDHQIIESRDLQDYQGMYLDLYGELRGEKNAEKEEINDDLVFEIELIKQVEVNIDYILALIEKYAKSSNEEKQGIKKEIETSINSSFEMRNKKDLIMAFVEYINNQSEDVFKDFEKYIEQKRNEEFDAIVKDNNLKKDEAYEFVKRAFKYGEMEFNGTEFPKLLPKGTSLFSKTSNYGETKEKISAILQRFFERFYSISNSEFKSGENQ